MSTDKTEITTDTAPEKKVILTEKRVQVIVAVLLGLTALLTAWATWIGSLHGGIQSINFTKSTKLSSEGTATFNSTMQVFISDMMVWNTASDYKLKAKVERMDGNEKEAKLYEEKAETFIKENGSDYLIEAIKKMDDNTKSPFEVKGVYEMYFKDSENYFKQSDEHLMEGKRDNAKGDAYNLVNVIYSLILFLLGIVNVFKDLFSKKLILGIAVFGLVVATIYMITIPLPTGFNLFNYIGFVAK